MNWAELIIEGFKKEKEFYMAFLISFALLIFGLIKFKYTGENWFINTIIFMGFIAVTGLLTHLIIDLKNFIYKRKKMIQETKIHIELAEKTYKQIFKILDELSQSQLELLQEFYIQKSNIIFVNQFAQPTIVALQAFGFHTIQMINRGQKIQLTIDDALYNVLESYFESQSQEA